MGAALEILGVGVHAAPQKRNLQQGHLTDRDLAEVDFGGRQIHGPQFAAPDVSPAPTAVSASLDILGERLSPL